MSNSMLEQTPKELKEVQKNEVADKIHSELSKNPQAYKDAIKPLNEGKDTGNNPAAKSMLDGFVIDDKNDKSAKTQPKDAEPKGEDSQGDKPSEPKEPETEQTMPDKAPEKSPEQPGPKVEEEKSAPKPESSPTDNPPVNQLDSTPSKSEISA